MTFEQECRDWLEPLGYSVHHHSGDREYFSFINFNEPNYPSISCTNRGGEKSCKLQSGLDKLFIRMETGDLQFKHPNIEKYIKTMAWYAKIFRLYLPKNNHFLNPQNYANSLTPSKNKVYHETMSIGAEIYPSYGYYLHGR